MNVCTIPGPLRRDAVGSLRHGHPLLNRGRRLAACHCHCHCHFSIGQPRVCRGLCFAQPRPVSIRRYNGYIEGGSLHGKTGSFHNRVRLGRESPWVRSPARVGVDEGGVRAEAKV